MGMRHQHADTAATPGRAASARAPKPLLDTPTARRARPRPAAPQPDGALLAGVALGRMAIHPPVLVPAPDDRVEREADALADRVVAQPGPSGGGAPSGSVRADAWAGTPRAHIPHPLGQATGQALPAATREDMAVRFGHALGRSHDRAALAADFARVRIHSGARAAAAADTLGALAYTAGDHIVFNAGAFAPHTPAGRRLLAHELAHVTQRAPELRCYRPNVKRSWNYGTQDDAGSGLVEDSFDVTKDKKTKPWLEKVQVEFDALKTDADGYTFSTGKASAKYYDNPVKWPDFRFDVGGGSRTLGRTDSGTFTVKRIEGIGYNSGAYSGTPGVDYDASDREGPGNRYSKSLSANMSYAVFYNGGEALHAGPLESSSHGCVHVDWSSMDTIRQLNYHSVIGLTQVAVKYLSKEEIEQRRIQEQIRLEALRGMGFSPYRGGRLPPP